MGVQRHESQLEAYLQAQEIPYATFDEADSYPDDGSHWTPRGHGLVAERLQRLLASTGNIPPGQPDRLAHASAP
jgi:hypothetical protein